MERAAGTQDGGGARPRPWAQLARSVWERIARQVRASVAARPEPLVPDAPIGATPTSTAPAAIAAATAPSPPRVPCAAPADRAPPARPPDDTVAGRPDRKPLPASPPPQAATVHLRLLAGQQASEVALLRADLGRREHEIMRLRSALSEVLARFAELAVQRSAPRSPVATRTETASEDPPPVPPVANATATPESRPELCARTSAPAEEGPPATAVHEPLVTVIVATSDWPHDLGAAVDSVVSQAYPSWELVVVDDRRPVEPPPLVAAGDGRVRVVLGPGRGDAAAYDRGCESAQGQLVAYLGDRTRMASGWLAALARAAHESPEADVFVGRALTLHGVGDAECIDRSTVGHRRERANPGGRRNSSMPGSQWLTEAPVRRLPVYASVSTGEHDCAAPARITAQERRPGSDPGLALVVG